MHGMLRSTGCHPRALAALAALCLLGTLGGCASRPSLADRQAETLVALGFKPVADGWQLTLPERISFEFNKAELAPALRMSIADAARQLLAVDIRQLRVEGHSDNIGAGEYNRDLSLRRANSVAAVAIAEGLSQESVISQGLGSSQPAADNASSEGRARNRRVEIIVTSNVLAGPEQR